MSSTPLHRALGRQPGPMDSTFLEEAIAIGLGESHDLDWKEKLPPAKNLRDHNYDKHIAAMANSGGGMLVVGITEKDGAASDRADACEDVEGWDRYQASLRQLCFNAIHPSVFGVEIERIAENPAAIAVIVPPSTEVPHFIVKNEGFRAPVRNGATTEWLSERQIETMYRTRFEQRSRMAQDLDALYDEARQSIDTTERAWLMAVAHPRVPGVTPGMDRREASSIFERSKEVTLVFSDRAPGASHPLERADVRNPRPGMRRWTVLNSDPQKRESWQGTFISIHHDGSVTVATAVGGMQDAQQSFAGTDVMAVAVEAAISDFMAVLRLHGKELGQGEYDVRVGVEWSDQDPLRILTRDPGTSIEEPRALMPRRHFTPVKTTVNTSSANAIYQQAVVDLAEDCIHQGGIQDRSLVRNAATGKDHPEAYREESPEDTERRIQGSWQGIPRHW